MAEVKGQVVAGNYRYALFVPEEGGNAQIKPLSRLVLLRTVAVREFDPAAALAAWPGEPPNGRRLTRSPLGRYTSGPVAATPGSVGVPRLRTVQPGSL